jgi:hypothetical protein
MSRRSWCWCHQCCLARPTLSSCQVLERRRLWVAASGCAIYRSWMAIMELVSRRAEGRLGIKRRAAARKLFLIRHSTRCYAAASSKGPWRTRVGTRATASGSRPARARPRPCQRPWTSARPSPAWPASPRRSSSPRSPAPTRSTCCVVTARTEAPVATQRRPEEALASRPSRRVGPLAPCPSSS